MSNDRTRTFKGKYTSDQKKVYHLNIRIFKRLVTFGLEINLLHRGLVEPQKEELTNTSGKASFDSDVFSEDKKLIEKIIIDEPYILKDVTMCTYTVKEDDTLSSIADFLGCTVEQLCYLNAIEENTPLYTGGTLKAEKVVDKAEIDMRISALESYFYDYLFKSSVAHMAFSKSDDVNHSQANYYKSVIYGNPKTVHDVDTSSIYGEYITNYIAYHEGQKKHSADEKKAYAEKLTSLTSKTEKDLNLNGTTDTVIPFEQYMTYLRAGTTKDTEIYCSQKNVANIAA